MTFTGQRLFNRNGALMLRGWPASTLRMVIRAEAKTLRCHSTRSRAELGSSAQNNIAAVSADGRTVCVLMGA